MILLAVFGLATVALILFAVAHGAPAEFFPVTPLASGALVFALAFFQLRHIGLALLAAFGPWLALPWLNAIALVWPEPLKLDPLAMAFGTATSALLAEACARNLVTMRDRPAAADLAMRQLWKTIFLVLAALAILLAGAAEFARVSWWSAMGAVLESALFAFPAATVVLFAPLLSYPEEFIALFNRWHEFEGRIFSNLARAAEPRWAWSFSGISLILATIVFFAVRPTVPMTAWLMLAAVSFAAALVQMRRWRSALSLPIALAFAALSGLWFGPMAVGAQGAVAWAIPLLAMLALGSKIAPLQENAEGAAALATAYAEQAGGILFALIAAAIALAGFAPFHPAAFVPAAAFIVAGGGAALIVQPSFTAVFAGLFPRRRSVEELYRAC